MHKETSLNTTASTSRHIVIAGAGLVGRLLAWRLLKEGHTVTLYEKTALNQPRSAAHTAAAMISPLSEVVVSDRRIYDMGMESLAQWPQWIDELNQHSPTPIFYRANGSLVVAHPHDDFELDQFQQDLHFHLADQNTAQWLTREELAHAEPDINPIFSRALLLPNEAYLDNRQLLNTLITQIQVLGGRVVENAHVTFTPEPQVNGLPFPDCDLVIDTRGVGAKPDSDKPVRGVRGEVLWVETKEVQLSRPIRMMHPRYKLYIVPKPHHRFIIGATEIESEDASPVSVQSMMELCSALYTINPAFSEARIIELDANLRPSHLDNMPSIELQANPDAIPRLNINGLYRHGYLLAPHLVNLAIQRINAHNTCRTTNTEHTN